MGEEILCYTSLPDTLPQHHAVTVVRSTRQQQELPQHLEQVIIDKAQGNPFFLEELTRAVIEHGDPAAAIDVPDTIQGVLSARIIDCPRHRSACYKRLRSWVRSLLQPCSRRWEGSDTLAAVLLELKHLELLYDRPGIEEPIYIFKHALTQEVAYDSLLTTRRQRLHATAGHAMERLYSGGLAEHYEALAHHFTLGAVWEKAFDYLTKSGDKARRTYANQEAVAFYTQALEVSQRITPALNDVHLLPVYEGRGSSGRTDQIRRGVCGFSADAPDRPCCGQSAQRRGKFVSSCPCPHVDAV